MVHDVGARSESKEKRARSTITDDTRAGMGTVKAAKAAARQFRESGLQPKLSTAAALTAVGVKKRAKQKRPRQAAGGLDDDEDAALLKAARLPSSVYAGAQLTSSMHVLDSAHRSRCRVWRSQSWLVVHQLVRPGA